jgi:hypothetical protein
VPTWYQNRAILSIQAYDAQLVIIDWSIVAYWHKKPMRLLLFLLCVFAALQANLGVAILA